jgi:hypothetical protein
MGFVDDFGLCQYNTLSKGMRPLGALLLTLIHKPLGCSGQIIFVDIQCFAALVECEVVAKTLIKLLDKF